jgi:hypothetical protein
MEREDALKFGERRRKCDGSVGEQMERWEKEARKKE